jgi:hypothetical protein
MPEILAFLDEVTVEEPCLSLFPPGGFDHGYTRASLSRWLEASPYPSQEVATMPITLPAVEAH